jgi:orotate phosphoribosyltransferase
MAGASVTETCRMLYGSGGTVLFVMTAFERENVRLAESRSCLRKTVDTLIE